MSYDIRIGVKAEGLGKIVEIRRPEYDSPTYNLVEMYNGPLVKTTREKFCVNRMSQK